MKRSNFTPIIIGVFALIIGGSYLYYQKQNQSTAPQFPSTEISKNTNLETYKNDLGGYTLSFPSDWGVRDLDINLFPKEYQKTIISYTSFSKVYKDNPDLRTDLLETPHGDPILKVEKAEGETLQQITDAFIKKLREAEGERNHFKRKEIRKIDNVDAILIVSDTEFDDSKPSYFNYLFIKDSKIYSLSYYSPDESPSVIPEKILSTFKFIN